MSEGGGRPEGANGLDGSFHKLEGNKSRQKGFGVGGGRLRPGGRIQLERGKRKNNILNGQLGGGGTLVNPWNFLKEEFTITGDKNSRVLAQGTILKEIRNTWGGMCNFLKRKIHLFAGRRTKLGELVELVMNGKKKKNTG